MCQSGPKIHGYWVAEINMKISWCAVPRAETRQFLSHASGDLNPDPDLPMGYEVFRLGRDIP